MKRPFTFSSCLFVFSIFGFFTLSTLPAHGQYGGEFAMYMDTEIANYGEYPVISPGLRLEAFLNENVSLNWRFAPGIRGGKFESFHFNPGIPATILILGVASNMDDDDDGCDICDPGCPDYDPFYCDSDEDEAEESGDGEALGTLGLAIIMLALPEGFSFHIPLGDEFSCSPYVNPVGIEYIRGDGEGVPGFLTPTSDFGVRFRYVTYNGITVAPYAGFKYRYRSREVGWTYGMGIGQIFGY